jgi:hypothetical protein
MLYVGAVSFVGRKSVFRGLVEQKNNVKISAKQTPNINSKLKTYVGEKEREITNVICCVNNYKSN